MRKVKSSNCPLYEEIIDGYDEEWTKPVSKVNSYTDGPMVDRLHKAIVDKRCMEYLSKRSYWVYRVIDWFFEPVIYVFWLFVLLFLYAFLKAILVD